MALDDVVILNVDTNTLETPFDDLQSLPNDVVGNEPLGSDPMGGCACDTSVGKGKWGRGGERHLWLSYGLRIALQFSVGSGSFVSVQ